MDTGPRIDSYEWSGGREAMLRWGPADGPVAVLALPLFEEANRTRAFGVSILRALAARGIGGVLPELPGQGESEVATEDARLSDLRAAFAAVPGTHMVAIRSGVLVVDNARPSWTLSAQDGPALLRELARMKSGTLNGELIEVAGNRVGRDLLDALASATFPGEGRGLVAMSNGEQLSLANASPLGPGFRRGRRVRLAGDPQHADRHVYGEPTWRRVEPGNDPMFAQLLAADIADWIAACER